jgi:hypothetical protein
MAARTRNSGKASKPAAQSVTAIDVTHTLAKAKPSTCGAAFDVLVTTYSDSVATRFASKGCRRLPRHEVTAEKGHKADVVVGLLTAKQRAARKAAAQVTKGKAARPKVIASKVVTVGGTKFRVFANGKVEPFVVTGAADVVKPAAKPRVRTLRPVPADRQVAAPRKVTRRSKTATPSGRPSTRLA